MRIGFCVTCMNRKWQVEQTLPWNLDVLASSGHFVALCNYNSSDGLHEYIVDNHRDDIGDGRLVYFRTSEPQAFHASSAKNTAHRLAIQHGADIVFNLDGDNFITEGSLALVQRVFTGDTPVLLHNWSRNWPDGTFGRIALRAQSWLAIGGYDEALLGMAWQDVDLVTRCRALGLTYVWSSESIKEAVPNTMAQKLANIVVPRQEQRVDPLQTFAAIHDANVNASFSRPIFLGPDQQRRYSGTINLERATVV
jgi:hypothetical protein